MHTGPPSPTIDRRGGNYVTIDYLFPESPPKHAAPCQWVLNIAWRKNSQDLAPPDRRHGTVRGVTSSPAADESGVALRVRTLARRGEFFLGTRIIIR